MKKRVISMIIVAIMLLTMLPAFAFAEDVQEAGTASLILKSAMVTVEDGALHYYMPDTPEEYTHWTMNRENGGAIGCFYYGDDVVNLSKLEYDNNKLQITEEDGILHINPLAYEGETEVRYTDGDITAKFPVYIMCPDIGLYTSAEPSAETYIVPEEAFVLTETSRTFYLCSGNSEWRKLKEYKGITLNGEDVSDKFEVETINNSKGDTCFKITAKTIEAVSNPWLVVEYTELYQDIITGEWTESQSIWKNIDIKYDISLSWKAAMVDVEDGAAHYYMPDDGPEYTSWIINREDAGASGCLYCGNNVADLSKLEYDEDKLQITEENGILFVKPLAYQGEAEVRYTDDSITAKFSFYISCPDIGFYTSAEPSAETYISPDDSFILTETDRTFYLCSGDSEWRKLKEYKGMLLDGEDVSEQFVVETINNANGDTCFKITVENYEPIPDSWLLVEYTVLYQDYMSDEWTESQPAWKHIDIKSYTSVLTEKLDEMIPSGNDAEVPSVDEVQDTLKDDTAELKEAMATDLGVSDDQSSGILERIETLENEISENSNIEAVVEATETAPESIKEIVEGVTMIGAVLNYDPSAEVEGDPPETPTPTVTLVLGEAEEGIVSEEQKANAVEFSIKLDGAVDKDGKDENGQQLIVPIVIDMPVPKSIINPDYLVILHRLHDGTIEQIIPHVYQNTEGKWHARFVVDSFSDYAMVEYVFAFKETEVSKTEGDEPFTLTASGNAEGSTVSYTSSNTAVASVNAETGEVTVLKAGTTTITATATATAVYPEISASYELTVTAKENPPVIPPVSPDTGDDDDDDTDDVKSNPFVDVDEGDYFYDAVIWAASGGITSGTDESHFSPDNVTSRAQMVTFLWRAMGCPEVEAEMPFTDVAEGSYYEKAVLWALANGITTGVSETSFAPDANVTRAQAVTFLARMAGVADKGEAMSHCFTDVSAEDYFNNAVAWAYENNITSGVTETTFAPNADCLRSQIVTFLWRYLVK